MPRKRKVESKEPGLSIEAQVEILLKRKAEAAKEGNLDHLGGTGIMETVKAHRKNVQKRLREVGESVRPQYERVLEELDVVIQHRIFTPKGDLDVPETIKIIQSRVAILIDGFGNGLTGGVRVIRKNFKSKK